MVLKPGQGQLLGSLVFGVVIDNHKSQELRLPVNLPKNVLDFRVDEGVTPSELKQDTTGQMFIEKKFEPGTTLVSISFILGAESSDVNVMVPIRYHVPQFLVLVPKEQLNLQSSQLQLDTSGAFPSPQFQVFTTDKPIFEGHALEFKVSGIPQSRKTLWLIGAICAVILLIFAGAMGVATRPRVDSKYL